MFLTDKQKDLIEVVKKNSCKIMDCKNFKLNKTALLLAIAMCESSLGTNNYPRYEPIYDCGGKYYQKSKTVQKLIGKYGTHAACSWSSFQIMYITAYELGYKGKPEDLKDDTIAIPFIINFINKRIIKKTPRKIQDILDAYNSGNFNDRYIPDAYIGKGMAYYEEFCIQYPDEDTLKSTFGEKIIINDESKEVKKKVKNNLKGDSKKKKNPLKEFLKKWKQLFFKNK